jgi:hypothetical protein
VGDKLLNSWLGTEEAVARIVAGVAIIVRAATGTVVATIITGVEWRTKIMNFQDMDQDPELQGVLLGMNNL